LIYDNHCSDIISPLLRVHQLREQGVTLHLLLHRDRQPIQDIPAIYFISPSLENVQRLGEDCASRLYESFYINFSSQLPQSIMEDLAAKTIRTESVNLIKSVYDQYLDFIGLEHNLFTLNVKGSLVACHHQKLTDAEAERNVELVAERLFGVLVTMGVTPIIQCPPNGMAEHVARSVDKKLREYLLHGGGDTPNASFSFQRPVLVLLDRSVDLSVMLHHPWTYQAMIQDMLKSSLNRVWFTPAPSEKEPNPKETIYDLEEDMDEFWAEHRYSQFPQTAQAVHERISELKKRKEELTKTIGDNIEGDELRKQLVDNTQNLRAMATSLPQLQEQKKYIDMHLVVATGLLHKINDHDLNLFVQLEDSIIRGLTQEKTEVLQVIRESKGSLEDKLRLYLIYYLNKDNVPAGEIEELEAAITKEAPYFSATSFIKKTKAFSTVINRKPVEPVRDQGGFMSKFGLSQLTTSSRMKDIFSLVQGGVNNMMNSPAKELPVTKLVKNIMDTKVTADTERYLYFDPKIQVGPSGQIPRKTTPFREAIVFMLGGGSYVEHQNLQTYAKKSPTPRNVIYGSTEILTSTEFLMQAEEIGNSY